MAKLVTVETGNSDPLGREAVIKHEGVLKEAQINGAGSAIQALLITKRTILWADATRWLLLKAI